MDDTLLTPAQMAPLLAMARFQRRHGQEVAFTVPLGGLLISYRERFSVMPPPNARQLWEKLGYVVVTPGKMYRAVPPEPEEDDPYTAAGWIKVDDDNAGEEDGQVWYTETEAHLITLTRRALALERWMRRPAPVRFVLRQFEKTFNRRDFFTGLAAGIASTLLAQYLLHLLGWL